MVRCVIHFKLSIHTIMVDISLSHLSEANSYNPFVSKLLASNCYLIVHSPRPMKKILVPFLLHRDKTLDIYPSHSEEPRVLQCQVYVI